MILNSVIVNNKADRLYSDSGAEDIFDWIQSPISRQTFEQGNQIIGGIYMQVKPFEIPLTDVESIMHEFSAWEAASDEDFFNFEKENL